MLYPIFFSYAYPPSVGFSKADVAPEAAKWNDTLGEFMLPYEDVRSSKDPEEALMQFLQSTYEAAARSGKWDRKALEQANLPPAATRGAQE